MDDRSVLRIKFPHLVPDLVIPISKDKPQVERSCEFVKWLCIKHLKDCNICEHLSSSNNYELLLASGLLIAESKNIWLSPNYIFEKNVEKQVCTFRIRHRPPASELYIESTILSEFFVLQALGDLLSLNSFLGKIVLNGDERESDVILQLTALALLFPSSLPLKNSYVIDGGHKVMPFSLFKYNKRFSKKVYRLLNTGENKIVQAIDHYYFFKAFLHAFTEYKSKEKNLKEYKKAFLDVLLGNFPSYCFESYSDGKVTVFMDLYGETTDQKPGIYLNENIECHLADVGRVDLKKVVSSDVKSKQQWQVELDNKFGPKSMDKILFFDDEGLAISFITMLQGYMNLCVQPDINLCRQFTSFSTTLRDSLKSFCPMSHDKAKEYLSNENDMKEVSNHCGFLIYQSREELHHFHVAIESSNEPVCEIRWQDRKWLSSSTGEEKFEVNALRTHLFEKYGQQLAATKASVMQTIDPKSVFYINQASVPSIEPEDVTFQLNRAPAYILQEDILPGQERLSNSEDDSHLKRWIVRVGEEKRVMLELVPKQKVYMEALHNGVAKVAKLSRLHPRIILEFYGPVIAPTTRLSFLFEHSPYGDLASFLKRTKNDLTALLKMSLAREVVEVFLTMTSSKEPLLHGNLRGHNFWVFKWNEKFYLKLGDPGLVHHYNTLQLEMPNNDKRIPWLSPERRLNLKQVTVSSECYSVATTIAEIFHATDDFRTIMNLPNDLKPYFERRGNTIPLPEFATTEDEAVMQSVRDVTEKLWNKLKICWDWSPDNRLSPQEFRDEIIDLTNETMQIPQETVFAHFKIMLSTFYRCPKEGLTSMSVCHRVLKDKNNFYVNPNRIEILNKRLGKGQFGVVDEGRLMIVDSGEKRSVAIKRMNPQHRTNKFVREFMKEIEICASMDHPNIAKFLGYSFLVSSNAEPCIVMEYLNKGSLKDYAIKNHEQMEPSDPRRPKYLKLLLKISLDIAKGMAYMEEMKIVHCDLASRNVLLSENQSGQISAKVSDFGLTKILNLDKDYYYQGDMLYNPKPVLWYPPEYLVYERECVKSEGITFTTAGDIWAYGTTLWEIFNKGKSPLTVLPELGLPPPKNSPILYEDILHEFYMEKKGRWPRQKKYMDEAVYNVMTECWREDERDRPSFIRLTKIMEILLSKY